MAVATPLLKRRQQVFKPRGSLDINVPLEPLLSGWQGQHRRDRYGKGSSVRPGSWTGAKAQDGSPGNLRDPTHVHARARRQIGSPAEQGSWPVAGPPSARERWHQRARSKEELRGLSRVNLDETRRLSGVIIDAGRRLGKGNVYCRRTADQPRRASAWRARSRQGQALTGAQARVLDRSCARRRRDNAGRDGETGFKSNKETDPED